MQIVTIKKFTAHGSQEPPGDHIEHARTLSELPVPDELITRQPVRQKGRQPSSPATLFINYPITGKRKLPVGTTKIDISTGTVFLADGTTEEMYSARPIEACRSLLMYTDQPIDIRLERDGTPHLLTTIFPEWTRMTDIMEFGVVEIDCAQETVFYIIMSEDPEGVPEYMPDHRLTPATYLGYNAADDLVSMKKIIEGVTYQRNIIDPDVADTTVDKWIEYSDWSVVT